MTLRDTVGVFNTPRKEFLQEYRFMLKMLGDEAAIYRLSNAYKIPPAEVIDVLRASKARRRIYAR